MRRIALVSLVFSLCSGAVSQEIWWTRIVPGERNQLWVYGRNLWAPINTQADNRYVSTGSLSPLGEGAPIPLSWDTLGGANAHAGMRDDPHYGNDRLQRFWLPQGVGSGTYRFTLTRADGRFATSLVDVAPMRLPRQFMIPSTAVEVWDRSRVLAPGETLDLQGATVIIPGNIALDREKAALVMQAGSRVTNGRILVPETSSRDMFAVIAVRGRGDRLMIDAVDIEDRRNGGQCFWGGDSAVSDSVFAYSAFQGDQCLSANLFTLSERNTFYRLELRGIRSYRSGGVGRLGGGTANLFCWVNIRDMDRGWTLSPWGSPLYRSVWFECDTDHTGRQIGASEGGILWESAEAGHGQGMVSRRSFAMALDPRTDSRTTRYALRPGMFLVAGGKWGVVRTIKASALLVEGELDRDIGEIRGLIRIGNAAVENFVSRCRFSDGRSALWFYGQSMANDFSQCVYTDLREPAVQQLVRPWMSQVNQPVEVSSGEIGNVRRFTDLMDAVEFGTRP